MAALLLICPSLGVSRRFFFLIYARIGSQQTPAGVRVFEEFQGFWGWRLMTLKYAVI